MIDRIDAAWNGPNKNAEHKCRYIDDGGYSGKLQGWHEFYRDNGGQNQGTKMQSQQHNKGQQLSGDLQRRKARIQYCENYQKFIWRGFNQYHVTESKYQPHQGVGQHISGWEC